MKKPSISRCIPKRRLVSRRSPCNYGLGGTKWSQYLIETCVSIIMATSHHFKGWTATVHYPLPVACSGLHSAERYEFNMPCSHPNLSTPSHQAPCRNLQLIPGLFSCIHMAHPYAPSHQLAENQDYEAHPPGERQESSFLFLVLKHV